MSSSRSSTGSHPRAANLSNVRQLVSSLGFGKSDEFFLWISSDQVDPWWYEFQSDFLFAQRWGWDPSSSLDAIHRTLQLGLQQPDHYRAMLMEGGAIKTDWSPEHHCGRFIFGVIYTSMRPNGTLRMLQAPERTLEDMTNLILGVLVYLVHRDNELSMRNGY